MLYIIATRTHWILMIRLSKNNVGPVLLSDKTIKNRNIFIHFGSLYMHAQYIQSTWLYLFIGKRWYIKYLENDSKIKWSDKGRRKLIPVTAGDKNPNILFLQNTVWNLRNYQHWQLPLLHFRCGFARLIFQFDASEWTSWKHNHMRKHAIVHIRVRNLPKVTNS